MHVNSINWQDAKKYYEKCWVKVKECGERAYLVTEIGQKVSYLEGISRGEGDDEFQVCIDMAVGYTIDYVIPKKTIYQYGENAVILQRVPARMWKKGMDTKNTQFLMLNDKTAWSPIDINMPVIEGFINKPSYSTVKEASQAFNGTLLSAALSPRIALTKMGSVFIDTVQVGKYSSNGTLIYKRIYHAELSKHFSNATLKAV